MKCRKRSVALLHVHSARSSTRICSLSILCTRLVALVRSPCLFPFAARVSLAKCRPLRARSFGRLSSKRSSTVSFPASSCPETRAESSISRTPGFAIVSLFHTKCLSLRPLENDTSYSAYHDFFSICLSLGLCAQPFPSLPLFISSLSSRTQ